MGDGLKMKRRTVDAVSVTAGAAAGMIAVLGGLPVAANVAIGVGAWAAVRWLVLGRLDRSAIHVGDGLSQEDVGQIIEDGLRQVRRLEELGGRVKRAAPRADVAAIGRTMRDIFEQFRENPSDVLLARKFLSIYMERAVSIVERYVEYQEYASPGAEQVRMRVERELLPRLRQLCREQYQRFLDDDIRDYDVDVEVLRKTIDFEGLG